MDETPSTQPDSAPAAPGSDPPSPGLHAVAGLRHPWRTTLLVIGLVTLGRMLYLIFMSPYGLVEDEAHYWEWSRHLGWSYYSKGPGVAYAIAASTALLGDTIVGVRFPSLLFCAGAALALAGLTFDTLRLGRGGLYAAVALLCAPFFLGAGVLMTIDMPYVACWLLASWMAWRAIEHRSTGLWMLTGLVIGIGFLFKYTALLLVPGILLYLLIRSRDPERRRVRWSALVLAAIVLLITMAPVGVWNDQWGWPTVRHLLGHLGVEGGDQAPPIMASCNPRYSRVHSSE